MEQDPEKGSACSETEYTAVIGPARFLIFAQQATAEQHGLLTTTEGLPVDEAYMDRVLYLAQLYEYLAMPRLNQPRQIRVAGLSATMLPMMPSMQPEGPHKLALTYVSI
jgi:hypothetical protein